MLNGEPDLFISLLPNAIYPLEYMARCSRARFKAGRQQLPGNVFDLVVMDPADKTLSQLEAFREIVKMLETVV
jgi:protein-tyrosine phosphatase